MCLGLEPIVDRPAGPLRRTTGGGRLRPWSKFLAEGRAFGQSCIERASRLQTCIRRPIQDYRPDRCFVQARAGDVVRSRTGRPPGAGQRPAAWARVADTPRDLHDDPVPSVPPPPFAAVQALGRALPGRAHLLHRPQLRRPRPRDGQGPVDREAAVLLHQVGRRDLVARRRRESPIRPQTANYPLRGRTRHRHRQGGCGGGRRRRRWTSSTATRSGST